MNAVADRQIERATLLALLPEGYESLVDALDVCPCCDKINIDASLSAMLQVITAAISTQEPGWARGATDTCVRVIERGRPLSATVHAIPIARKDELP